LIRQQRDRRQAAGSSKPPQRASSPPPHIVGQIVEMGFSPSQARTALAKTSTGLDVGAALEILLGSPSAQRSQQDDDESHINGDSRRERDRIQQEEEERERRRRRRAGPSRDSVKTRVRDDRDDVPTGSSTPELGEQADRILAQASEMGQSVLSKATSFWNTGKEKALRAYEEQQKRAAEAAKGRNGGDERKDGRPRWMTESAVEEGDEVHQPENAGFQDDDGDQVLPQRPVNKSNGGPIASASRKPRVVVEDEPYHSVKERADLLFDDQPRSYKPANRHRKPTPNTPRASPPVRPATPIITRQLVQATPTHIANSSRYKAAGNDHYKLGRFTEASASYTTAITSLPERHILLVPIYNNRAATRLKLGESSGAIEDCTVVVEMIGIGYNPTKETPLPPEYAEVKLGEGLTKAITKRAQAWEMAEKWKSAVEDWERVLGFDTSLFGPTAVTTRNLAVEGVRRCKRMLEGGDGVKPVEQNARARPKGPALPTTASTPADPDKSEAVTAMRQANLATEAEDAQKLALKDSVDGRLNIWKAGKETNLRALLSSLSTVLWDEILSGGLKVGMHELISEKQVKIKYMKVIARLHPDKVGWPKLDVVLAYTSFLSAECDKYKCGAANASQWGFQRSERRVRQRTDSSGIVC
jgi:tetratricopeptide (TPR) repeat protein